MDGESQEKGGAAWDRKKRLGDRQKGKEWAGREEKEGKCPRLRRKGAGSVENFWVAEESEGIGEAVRRQLGERDRRTAAGGSPWLLVVSPRAAERRRQLPTGCRTVLLPGGAGGLLSGLDPAAAVSYGTGPRDTLTLSSREGRQLWCAIQRELVTVEGRVVERQELPLRLPDHMSPLSVLAAAGALLLLGVPPEELGRDRGAVRGGQG